MLTALIEEADHSYHSVSQAVAAIFDADPAQAFDRLAAYFAPERLRQPGGAAIASAVLRLFAPGASRVGVRLWSQPQAPAWFQQDPRWLELCIRFRLDEQLGPYVRDVLRQSMRAPVRTALAGARLREGPRVVPWRSSAPGDLIARYRRGEHAAVWTELRAHEAITAPCARKRSRWREKRCSGWRDPPISSRNGSPRADGRRCPARCVRRPAPRTSRSSPISSGWRARRRRPACAASGTPSAASISSGTTTATTIRRLSVSA